MMSGSAASAIEKPKSEDVLEGSDQSLAEDKN
jgi:hypothetical protein